MHVITKSCFLLLWMHTLTFVKSQAQRCPSIHVPSNVKVIGNAEEATYGNIVRFSCKSSEAILNGPREIFCNEHGEWSDRMNITCEVVKCKKPAVENAVVHGNANEYNENDVLSYTCNSGYKRGQEIDSRCRKSGSSVTWIPTPACEAIKCELTLPPVTGTTYEPAYRSRFSPGEMIRVTCGDRYWISDGHSRSRLAETTCEEAGQWTIRPVCQEVTCSRPRDTYLSSWDDYFWSRQQKKLGDTVRYGCKPGYKSTGGATWAICTRDGWEPNPLCQKIPLCGRPPALEDGEVKNTTKERYSHRETIEYMCQSYYTMEGDPYRTCYNGKWTGQMRCLNPCVANEDEMRQHNITFKSNDYNKYLVHDEIIEFKCASGLPVGKVAMHQRCNSGVIVLPTCREDLS